MPRRAADREFDLVVWGATGFTGGLTAEYLVSSYGPTSGSSTPLRIALGGRSASRLEAVRASLPGGGEGVTVVVADAGDQESVDAMAARTSVVVAAAGPFARFGTPVVSACARLGTDYVDITGEAPWARKMIDRFSVDARGSGAVIVSMCGFDSVPADLSAFMLHRFARDTVGSPLAEVTSYVYSKGGGISGGTVASMANLMKDGEARRASADPFLLNPANRRPAAVTAHGKDVVCPGRSAAEEVYTLPFVMAAVNCKVVRRSAALLGYGDSFSYNEVMAVRTFPVAVLAYLGLVFFVLGLLFPPARYLLLRFALPKPGEGPDAESRDKARFRYRARATTESGDTLASTFAGRDPGYGDTAKMLGESGVALALRRRGHPVAANKAPGFHTPASAMGDVLVERLRGAGLTLSVGRI